jgi:hypothetical protein
MSAPESGTLVAQGIFSYTVDDRPRASETWRMSRLPDDRLHIQSLTGAGQQIFYGMDVLVGAGGVVDEIHLRVQGQDGERQAALRFEGDGVRGQVTGPQGARQIALALPVGALPYTESIAPRMVLGRALDFSREDDQPLDLCIVPVMGERGAPLEPALAHASAAVLGSEEVELLMANVAATHVVFDVPGNPPQHAWFDERRFPVRWYWVGHQADGSAAAHELSLVRYGWLAP